VANVYIAKRAPRCDVDWIRRLLYFRHDRIGPHYCVSRLQFSAPVLGPSSRPQFSAPVLGPQLLRIDLVAACQEYEESVGRAKESGGRKQAVSSLR
jgi:hypothetical protein